MLILYFSGKRLTAYLFEKGHIADQQVFHSTDDDLERFSDYCQFLEKTNTRILIDIIEEDFRQDSMPHTRGADKRALMQRLADKNFRGIKRKIIRSSKSRQRKLDLLISAIGNNDLMSSWLHVLMRNKMPIEGLYSVPYLNELLLKKIKPAEQRVLLVSQQLVSSTRFSFLEQGRLCFSRLTPSGDDESPDDPAFLDKEIEKNFRYMLNARWVSSVNDLRVIVITNTDETHARYRDYFSQKRLEWLVLVVQRDALLRDMGCYTNGRYSDVLYVGLLAQTVKLKHDYALKSDKKYYYNKLFARWFYAASFLAIFSAVLALGFGVWGYLQIQENKRHVESQQQRIEADIDSVTLQLRSDLPEPKVVKRAVETVDALMQFPRYRNSVLMTALAQTLAQYPGVQLQSVAWASNSVNAFEANNGKLLPQQLSKRDLKKQKQQDGDAWYEAVLVVGAVGDINTQPREGVRIFDDFSRDLSSLNELESLTVLTTPFEISSRSTFSGNLSVDNQQPVHSSAFELMLVRRIAVDNETENDDG